MPLPATNTIGSTCLIGCRRPSFTRRPTTSPFESFIPRTPITKCPIPYIGPNPDSTPFLPLCSSHIRHTGGCLYPEWRCREGCRTLHGDPHVPSAVIPPLPITGEGWGEGKCPLRALCGESPYTHQFPRAIGPGLSCRNVLYVSPLTSECDATADSYSASRSFHCHATYRLASASTTAGP